jgi:hypothetical protein
MRIHGAGPVDGPGQYMSLVRGEIQGQTEAAIITGQYLCAHNALHTPVHFYGDNQGVQNKCNTYNPHKLTMHRDPNSDLFLECKVATRSLHKQTHWVASHQDDGTPWNTPEELTTLKLPPEATLNEWCDKRAEEAWLSNTSNPDADIFQKNGHFSQPYQHPTKSSANLIMRS